MNLVKRCKIGPGLPLLQIHLILMIKLILHLILLIIHILTQIITQILEGAIFNIRI